MPDALLNIPIRGRKLSMNVEVQDVLARVESPFQTIEVVQTEAFGKILLLDGHVQLSSLDEQCYHEALVHIPLLSLNEPKRALVVGGGDGGVLRELCRHRHLERIDMVEIDEAVVETSKRFLPELSNGAFDDPRVRLHIADAFGFMKEAGRSGDSENLHPPAPSFSGAGGGGAYDLLVLDITDVYEGEDGALSEQLFTAQFYADCARALSPSGLLVTQADNHVFCPYSMEAVVDALRPHFGRLGSFQALVPSFGGFSAYVWASPEGEIAKAMPATDLSLSYLNATTWDLAFLELPFARLKK